MTDSKVFKKGITRLEAAFRIKPLSKESCALYWELLHSLSEEKFLKEVENIIMTEDKFPSVARLLKQEVIPYDGIAHLKRLKEKAKANE